MTVCREGEVFQCFVDRQQYARTTRTFCFESKDRQEVQVRVQLRWKLTNAKVWMVRKGASEDIFDAIEELSESLLRDAIATMTYEECHQQATVGYEMIETAVVDRLRSECQALGGVLVGFEIRSLRFPLLEERNKVRAARETEMSEKILEQKRLLGVEIEKWKSDDAKLMYQMREEKNRLVHDTKMQVLRDSESLTNMKAEAKLDLAQQQFAVEKRMVQLNAEKSQQILELQQTEAKTQSSMRQQLSEASSKANEAIQEAKALADSERAKADAKALAKIKMAEADAKAANLIGSAYKDNSAYMELQVARLHSDLQQVRANALGDAVKFGTMLPVHLQKEMMAFRSVGSQL